MSDGERTGKFEPIVRLSPRPPSVTFTTATEAVNWFVWNIVNGHLSLREIVAAVRRERQKEAA